jgi:hypothetical protein
MRSIAIPGYFSTQCIIRSWTSPMAMCLTLPRFEESIPLAVNVSRRRLAGMKVAPEGGDHGSVEHLPGSAGCQIFTSELSVHRRNLQPLAAKVDVNRVCHCYHCVTASPA